MDKQKTAAKAPREKDGNYVLKLTSGIVIGLGFVDVFLILALGGGREIVEADTLAAGDETEHDGDENDDECAD